MKQYLNKYKGKNILITGGAGCIGSNLTKALIEAEAGKRNSNTAAPVGNKLVD